MRVYRERLVVPATWWLWCTGCVVLLGTTVWAGLSVLIGVAVYIILEAGSAALLLSWGSLRIEVTGTELIVGSRRLALSEIGSSAALDIEQTRALRGPRADPAAYLIVRPYLPRAVYVETAGRPAGEPYWLIATREPELLAGAIEQARLGAVGRAACDDAAGDHRADGGSTRVDAASQGKDRNAW